MDSFWTNCPESGIFDAVRVIKPATIEEWMESHPGARSGLRFWLDLMRGGRWRSFSELRRTLPSADLVKVASGRNMVVFNIGGNQYRLIAAIHFNTQVAFALAFLTHAEYSKDTWKNHL